MATSAFSCRALLDSLVPEAVPAVAGSAPQQALLQRQPSLLSEVGAVISAAAIAERLGGTASAAPLLDVNGRGGGGISSVRANSGAAAAGAAASGASMSSTSGGGPAAASAAALAAAAAAPPASARLAQQEAGEGPSNPKALTVHQILNDLTRDWGAVAAVNLTLSPARSSPLLAAAESSVRPLDRHNPGAAGGAGGGGLAAAAARYGPTMMGSSSPTAAPLLAQGSGMKHVNVNVRTRMAAEAESPASSSSGGGGPVVGAATAPATPTASGKVQQLTYGPLHHHLPAAAPSGTAAAAVQAAPPFFSPPAGQASAKGGATISGGGTGSYGMLLPSTPGTRAAQLAASELGQVFGSPRPAGPGIKERVKFHLMRQQHS